MAQHTAHPVGLRRCVAALSLAVALGACDGSTAPAPPLSGRYVLTSVAGRSLPLPLPAGNGTADTLVADTLVFGADRQAQHHSVIADAAEPSAGPPGRQARTLWLAYRRIGPSVQFQVLCPPNALCLAVLITERGWLSNGDRDLRLDSFFGADARYVRVQ